MSTTGMAEALPGTDHGEDRLDQATGGGNSAAELVQTLQCNAKPGERLPPKLMPL